MARHSVMFILLFAFLGTVFADQICLRTQAAWTSNHNWVKDAGTNCALRVKAYVKNYGWKYAFIDRHASSNWRNTEYGQAYVSRQRVHEHTDSCFEMQAGLGNVDENRSIYVSLVDYSCNDAMWVDRFFIPHRGMAWGDSLNAWEASFKSNHGWCMNGKKYMPSQSFVRHGAGHNLDWASYTEGCAREIELRPNSQVRIVRWGSTKGQGSVSGRRALREAHPEQNPRLMSLEESQRREFALIDSMYDICENAYSYDHDRTDRYRSETQTLVARCFQMLERFLPTYQALAEAVETDTRYPAHILEEQPEPEQDIRYMGFPEAVQQEVALIEDLYNVCENFGDWDYDRTDGYQVETQLIVARCYDMLGPFLGTYQEFQVEEEKPLEADLSNSNPSVEDDRESQDLETSESDRQKTTSRLLSTTVYPLP